MKIRESADRLVVDNSLVTPVATGVILGVGGIGIGILGFLNHLWWLPLLGLALLVVGAVVIAFSKSTQIVLARSGDSSIAAKTLFTQSKSTSFALADVTSVQLETSQTRQMARGPDGSQRYETRVASNLFLMLRGTERMQIGNQIRAMNIDGMIGALLQAVPLKVEAEGIARFIGVPLQSHENVALGATSTNRIG